MERTKRRNNVTVTEASKISGINKAVLRSYIKKGVLPVSEGKGVCKIPLDELEYFCYTAYYSDKRRFAMYDVADFSKHANYFLYGIL